MSQVVKSRCLAYNIIVLRGSTGFTTFYVRITTFSRQKPRAELARCQLANLTPQRAEGTRLAPRWRLRPGRRAPRHFSGASVPAVSGPVLAGFGRFRRPARRTSTPSGARRGPWAAALPRRGSPGPVGARRGDLRAAPGAVGRQGAVCPRLAAGGPRGEVPLPK